MDKMTKELHKKNVYIKRTEDCHKSMVRFLKSDKGAEMLKLFHRMPIKALLKKFGAPNVSIWLRSSSRIAGFMHTAIDKAGRTALTEYNICDYTHINADVKAEKMKMLANKEAEYDRKREKFVKNYRKNKPLPCLTPFEYKFLNMKDNWVIKKNNKGEPIIRTESIDGVEMRLYDKESGLPYYKYTPKPKTMGIAYKLHMLELHKMAKYDKKMAVREEMDKRSDLFPNQIVAKYKMLREAHLEQLRKDLSDKYCPVAVNAIIVNRKNDSVVQKTIMQVKLGKIRSDTLDCNTKLNGDMKHKLSEAIKIANASNPGCEVSCLHLTSHNPNKKLIVMPHMLAAA